MRISAVVVLLLCFPTASMAISPICKEPGWRSVPRTHPACLFYKGTRHYRAKEYGAAFNAWNAIVEQNHVPEEFEDLRVNAQNNLGYLYYMGLGVKQNQKLAIERYWQPAEKAGHGEAAYHLCHAYADENVNLARSQCQEALRRYTKDGGSGPDDSEVVNQIRSYISRLEGR